MGNDDYVQQAFEDGRIVTPEDAGAGDPPVPGATDPVVPGEETGFALTAKEGALSVNDRLAEVVDDHGESLSFGSRDQAEAFAARLSGEGGALQVQAAAPNDPSDADAYLLADHDPSIREPAAVDEGTWTFDVGANLYGALGEAVVTAGASPPALTYFVEQDLEAESCDLDHGLTVCVREAGGVSVGDGEGRWLPDCRVEARDGPGGDLLERYWCEIKTGDASFERSQVAAMRALACEERVLKIRVLIDDLPDQYAVRVHEVEPDDA